MKKIAIIFSVISLVWVLPPATIQAQEATLQKTSGLTVSPFLIEDSFEKGKSKTFEVEIANNGEFPVMLNMSINDFEPTGTKGQIQFLPTGKNTDPRISLVPWIEITEQPNWNLAGFSKTKVKFKITPPTQAEPGTHYAGMLFGIQTPDNPNGSTVVQKLSTLIIAKLGKPKESGSVKGLKVTKIGKDQRLLDFVLAFTNTGNVHLKPKGEIEIKNWLGKTVGFAYINKDAQIVLPKTERELQTTFESKPLFGYYTLEGWIKYGDDKTEERFSQKIWILPTGLLLRYLSLMGIIIITLYFGIKKYNKYLLRKANLQK